MSRMNAMKVGLERVGAVLYVIVGATALTVVIGVVLLLVGPCGHKHRPAKPRKARK